MRQMKLLRCVRVYVIENPNRGRVSGCGDGGGWSDTHPYYLKRGHAPEDEVGVANQEELQAFWIIRLHRGNYPLRVRHEVGVHVGVRLPLAVPDARDVPVRVARRRGDRLQHPVGVLHHLLERELSTWVVVAASELKGRWH